MDNMVVTCSVYSVNPSAVRLMNICVCVNRLSLTSHCEVHVTYAASYCEYWILCQEEL